MLMPTSMYSNCFSAFLEKEVDENYADVLYINHVDEKGVP
jgi:hypothetical protein